MVRLCLLSLLLVSVLGAQTTIEDVLLNADTTKFQGQCTISWRQFTQGVKTIAAGQTHLVIVDGFLRVDLEPNDTATPVGTSYRVECSASDSPVRFRERWVVTTSGTPLSVSAVRVSVAPSPTVLIALSQLSPIGASSGQVVQFNGSTGS